MTETPAELPPPPDATASKERGWRFPKWRLGCLGFLLVLIGGPIWWWTSSTRAAELRAERAAQRHLQQAGETFEPLFASLEQGIADEEPEYDIDKTIRVIHEIDLALEQEESLEEYIRAISMKDYRDVAPEVLEARKEVLDIVLRLYEKQVVAEDQEAMWEITSELLLSTFSVVSVQGGVGMGASGGFAVDRAQAQELLQDLKKDQSDRRELMADIAAIEKELYAALIGNSEIYYTYLQEWDELSVLRDRAYLAAHNGDWEEVVASAELAIERAPHEKEAHLLKAMALIELDEPERDEEVARLLAGYIEEHPDSSAPAFLLLGVLHQRRGNAEDATLAFQQSAAYFPRQADHLTDMLDPYKMRSYLRKSREGSFILEKYKSTMLGAGYFSPDLQMARAHFDVGDFDEGKAKVLDHFARRRTQEQWDFILSDIVFCHELLGPHFWEIFPEDSYLDLEVSPTLMGSGLNLAVNNRSPRTLHNVTLVLALHFTDMYPNDYEALSAPQTVPAVVAHDRTSFGSVEVKVEVFGRTKTVGDIVTHRAIVISNEAVTWVDTDKYKIAEAEEFREARRMAARDDRLLVHPVAERHPEFQDTVDTLMGEMGDATTFELESRYGSDHVLVKLPRELAILRPVFRLRYGDELYAADDNLIEGDRIELRFKGVENFDDETIAPDDLELLMASPFGDVVVTWGQEGEVSWHLESGATTEDASPVP